MTRRFIGIDPGTTGAIVILNEGGGLEAASLMPVRRVGKRHEVDAYNLAVILDGEGETRAAIEDVNAFGMGRTSAFTFGKNVGACLALLDALEIPTMRVLPRLWQELFWARGDCDDTKGAAVAVALDRWPCLGEALRIKKNQGIADAALIAEWCRVTVIP